MKAMDKEGTKRKTLIGLVVLVFLAVSIGAVVMFNKSQLDRIQLNSENTELEDVLFERDSMVNELISTLDTIESNLTFINKRRSQLVLQNSESIPTKNKSIIRDIQAMNAMLEKSRLEIEELGKKFEKSGIQLKSFRNKIAGLNKRIEQQNNQIVDLKLLVEKQNTRLVSINQQKDSLQNQVLSFRDTIMYKEEIINQKEELINEQVDQLNTGYFAFGTFKELTENGVVLKRGGFLGIGKNRVLQNNFNEDYFTKIDITQNQSIPLNARKVNLISEHPFSSYKLIEEDGLITKLEIEAPDDFWKISHYAVIEVKL
jgi:hypothetical protein